MKYLLLLSTLLFVGFLKANSINKFVGNTGFELITGREAKDGEYEQERIRYHLLYVEHLLRSVPTNHLQFFQKIRRSKMLDLLHEYAHAGQFPQNTKVKNERRPCFIDENNQVCAVGYLVVNTEGWEQANRINSQFQYDYIHDMDENLISQWAEKNGLTLEECAMIQPTYEWVPFYTKSLNLSVGSAYRFTKDIYSTVSLSYSFNTAFKRNFKSNIGLVFSSLKEKNYALMAFYEKAVYTWRGIRGYIGVGGEYYGIEGQFGYNLVPNTALVYQYARGRSVFEARMSYGHHVNLSNSFDYKVGRNEIGVSVGLGFRL
ncbi:hypothetical protein [Crocinitomix algicola]|uniref:hypothetical protein n=1 Tax=Crocinitomix algicola TaxID=1740263 RepID=UPI00082FE079|nr:hypothetical protein [Crocinitomix algicola]